jgi:hypothetical protein
MTWSIFLARFDLDFGVRLSVLTGDRPGEGELSPLHDRVDRHSVSVVPSRHAQGHIDALSLWTGQSVRTCQRCSLSALLGDGVGRPFSEALHARSASETIASCFGWRCAAVADEVIE